MRNRQSFFSKITNPKYIMVYATIGIFLVIYAIGAFLYGDKGFLTVRTFRNFSSWHDYGINHRRY